MSKPTPGPWEWREDQGDLISTPLYKAWEDSTFQTEWPFVLQGSSHHDGSTSVEADNPADKAIIAAAPDLLEALKGLHDEMVDLVLGQPYKNETWLDRARAAIAKAEGK